VPLSSTLPFFISLNYPVCQDFANGGFWYLGGMWGFEKSKSPYFPRFPVDRRR